MTPLGFAILLMVIGIILLVIEIFVPDFGMIALIAVIMFVASMVVTAVAVPNGLFIVLIKLLVVAAVFFGFFKIVKKKRIYDKVILNETLNQEKDEFGGLDFFLGKVGVTKTPLKPLGTADFNGHVLEVSSEGSFITKEKKVKVIDVSNNKIIVRLLETAEN